eukprot:CAMPEP_0113913392 /NCGR_PEP_ID=MMETSP0780_2-20120614/29535_1 /TAXON_ID=652834 /ORGANISM="Palpitomonas bilix" /LENGTH=394 /DNA_ID=CAMNT_0000910613 /DNA_START=197 /DNA_END=1378 /DNA_ORIENTATION=- /assembly_acc=CAM_ASM_000599
MRHAKGFGLPPLRRDHRSLFFLLSFFLNFALALLLFASIGHIHTLITAESKPKPELQCAFRTREGCKEECERDFNSAVVHDTPISHLDEGESRYGVEAERRASLARFHSMLAPDVDPPPLHAGVVQVEWIEVGKDRKGEGISAIVNILSSRDPVIVNILSSRDPASRPSIAIVKGALPRYDTQGITKLEDDITSLAKSLPDYRIFYSPPSLHPTIAGQILLYVVLRENGNSFRLSQVEVDAPVRVGVGGQGDVGWMEVLEGNVKVEGKERKIAVAIPSFRVQSGDTTSACYLMSSLHARVNADKTRWKADTVVYLAGQEWGEVAEIGLPFFSSLPSKCGGSKNRGSSSMSRESSKVGEKAGKEWCEVSNMKGATSKMVAHLFSSAFAASTSSSS